MSVERRGKMKKVGLWRKDVLNIDNQEPCKPL